jgi:cytochrome c oxidase subunit II
MLQDLPLFPPSASTVSDSVDRLYLFLIAMSAFFALLICALIVVFATRYRKGKQGAKATHIEGSLQLELLWTLVPLALALGVFVWGGALFFRTARPPQGAMPFTATAKQWMWKLQHPTGQREINALHIPKGVPIQITMTSEDVIHSFFVPAFRTKQDVLPGRYSTTWFQATRTGTFHLFCAEYCGTKHSEMIGKVIVMEPLDYQRWLSGAIAGETPEQTGEKLFGALRCDTCHSNQSGARGPDLAGLWGRPVRVQSGAAAVFDGDYVRESILRPNARLAEGFQALMPTYQGQVSEEQILALIAYLESLGKQSAAGAAGEAR